MIRKSDLLKKINSLRFDLDWLQRTITNVNNRKGLATTKQLQCAAKEHNFVFERKSGNYVWVSFDTSKVHSIDYEFQFKCTNCNLTITKTIDELAATEKKALKDLGILEEEKENGESPTTENQN